MSGYYDELLEEISRMTEAGELQNALFQIEKELKMPYVPADIEEKLLAMKRELAYRISEKKESSEWPLEKILRMLKGNDASQLAAASRLASRNLRECTAEIREYLVSDPCPEAAAMILEVIAEQQIRDEFTYIKDDVEYTFWGDSLTPVAESQGFLEADRYLKDWLENDHPDYYSMARTLLIHEAYMFLPLTYESAEAQELAREMLEKVSSLMDEGELYASLMENTADRKRS